MESSWKTFSSISGDSRQKTIAWLSLLSGCSCIISNNSINISLFFQAKLLEGDLIFWQSFTEPYAHGLKSPIDQCCA